MEIVAIVALAILILAANRFVRWPQLKSSHPGNLTWPILETPNPDRLKLFYSERIGFEALPVSDSEKDCILDRQGFRLKIRQAAKSVLLVTKEPLIPIHQDSRLVLYAPCAKPGEFREELISRQVDVSKIYEETPYLNHSFEGFYIDDPDGNRLCFFADHHGPSIATDWDWCWE